MSPEINQVQRRAKPPFAQAKSQTRPLRAQDGALRGLRGAVAHNDFRFKQAADGCGDGGKIAVIDGLKGCFPPLPKNSPVFSQSRGPGLTVQTQPEHLRAGIKQARQRRKAGVHAKAHPALLLQGQDQALALHKIAETGRL